MISLLTTCALVYESMYNVVTFNLYPSNTCSSFWTFHFNMEMIQFIVSTCLPRHMSAKKCQYIYLFQKNTYCNCTFLTGNNKWILLLLLFIFEYFNYWVFPLIMYWRLLLSCFSSYTFYGTFFYLTFLYVKILLQGCDGVS